jgi:hypothetical protein
MATDVANPLFRVVRTGNAFVSMRLPLKFMLLRLDCAVLTGCGPQSLLPHLAGVSVRGGFGTYLRGRRYLWMFYRAVVSA